MNPEVINQLAVKAKDGDQEAMNELYRHFIPKINAIAEEVWYNLKDESALRYACYKQIEYTVKYYNPNKAQNKANFETLLMKNIYRVKHKYLNDASRSINREETVSLESITVTDKKGETWAYDPPADIDIEKEVLQQEVQKEVTKKIAASWGRGGARKKVIIGGWIDGLNDSEIAEEMGARFGGSVESHRKYIQRFKNRCRQTVLV